MKKILSIVLWCFCTTITSYAQKPGNVVPEKTGNALAVKSVFKISPSIIKQGDNIQITYDPAVNAGTPVKGTVYLFKNFKWQGYDLPLIKSDSGYTSSYTIPDGVAMLACRFSIGDSIDRGARFPYATVVYKKDKQMEPGGYIEWGLLRSKDASGNMSALVAKESLIEPKVLVQLWISKEFNNPLVKRNLFFDISRGLKAYFPQAKADSILFKTATTITGLPDVTEKELVTVEKVYRTILNNQAKADSLKSVILTKYPEGLMKRLLLIRAIYGERDKDKKVELWNDFIKKYPFGTYPFGDYTDPALGDRSFFSNAYVGVTNITFQKHDMNQVVKLVSDGPFSMIGYFYDHYVDYPFRQQVSPITDQEALMLSNAITSVLLKRIDAAVLADRGIYAPAEWTKQEMMNNAGVWAYHIGLLYKNGQFDTALKIADKVKPYLGYKFINFNTLYAKLLDHFHKTAEAAAYITAVIKADTASPEIIAMLKSNWVKAHGGKENGFDAYYEALRPGGKLKDMQTRLKASMVRIPAVNFNLQNLTGQQVDLSAQKGKIVVLDFWASWCYPCKQAMPGMQTLVHKYQPGGDVAFFFIATLEESPNYKKLINDFLAAKKYDFNVLYDAEDPGTKKMGLTFNDYAKLLKLSGIPQKIIIDQNGIVRWVAGGFGGDTIELTDEVSYIIDLLKKEKG